MTGDLQEPGLEKNDAAEDGAAPRATSLDEVKERLKARGLLTDAPAVVIPKEPRRAPVESPYPEAEPPAEAHWAESPYDAWDVTPGPDVVPVPCPRCRKQCDVPMEGTRLLCPSCDRAWRYVVCPRCDLLDLTVERQESWQCHRCGTFSRSWWRTPSARMLAMPVIVRRRDVAVQEQRRSVREGMRLRRWKLIAFGVCAALAAAVFVVATHAAEPSDATGKSVACPHFRSILEDVAAGRITPSELDAQLERLQAEAQGEGPEIATAVAGMRAASGPTSPEFITSRAALVDACGSAFGRS